VDCRRRRCRWSGTRDTIQDPPKQPPSFTAFSFVTQVDEISPESIARIKDEFRDATGQTCSTFDAVTPLLFKCRAQAAGLPDAAEVRLGFAASTRHLLQGVLPSVDGYYGNCARVPGGRQSDQQGHARGVAGGGGGRDAGGQ
jgi:hypothetical protein